MSIIKKLFGNKRVGTVEEAVMGGQPRVIGKVKYNKKR